MIPAAHVLLSILALFPATLRSAEEKPIIGFTFTIDGGAAMFRLDGHRLFFNENDQAEESVTLTDEQVAHTLMLLTINPVIAAKFAKKPAGKAFMECHLIRAGGGAEDRYLTDAEVKGLDEDLEAKAKANPDDPKILESIDQQQELFRNLFTLAMGSRLIRNGAPAKP